jgi:hypothetical protein
VGREYDTPHYLQILDRIDGGSNLIDIAMKSSSRFFKQPIRGQEKGITVGHWK